MNPAAILALIGELWSQLNEMKIENAALKAELARRQQEEEHHD